MKSFLRKLFAANFLLGPAIWCSKSEQAAIHRRMVVQFRPSHNRVVAWLNVVLCYASWYGYFAWSNLLTNVALIRASGDKKILGDLLYLVFWLGGKVESHSVLKLSEHARSDWLKFVFPQEKVHWQTIQMPLDSTLERQILNDKEQFSVYCNEHNVNAIATIGVIEKGSGDVSQSVFRQNSVFLKPSNLNSLRGCFALEYGSSGYSLRGWGLDRKYSVQHSKELIVDTLQGITQRHSVLIQPLLKNHDCLNVLASNERQTEDLATLRFFTVLKGNEEFSLEAAALQVARHDGRSWDIFYINAESGLIELSKSEPDLNADSLAILQPFWQCIRAELEKAHLLFSGIRVVAWDVGLTPKGPIIIEGNWGWDPISFQALRANPLLNGKALEIYTRTKQKRRS